MADTSATGSAPVGKRTFDCPWCGAITVIPIDHMGEHFACPECKKATKLTTKNTSSGKPTAPPPDAPHLSGDRTFDCPWCSLISNISAAYVGEHFKCPECKRSTKITETNTTRAGVTVPPSEAQSAGAKKALIAVAILAVVGLGVWLGVSSASGEKDKPSKESASAPPASSPGRTSTEPSTPGPAAPEAMATEPSAPPESTPPAMEGTEASTAPAVPPADAPPPPDAARTAEQIAAAHALEAASTRVEAARVAVSQAKLALAQWEAANPDAKDTVGNLETLHSLVKETDRMRAGLDPAKVTPDQVRGFNVGVMTYVMSDTKRVRIAESLLSWMKADLHGRHVLGLEWTGLDFHGPGFERAMKDLELRWLTAPATPSELRQAVADAEAAQTKAEYERDAAAKAAQELEGAAGK